MKTVRLTRLDGTSLTFRISKAAQDRWDAAPHFKIPLFQLSVLEACNDCDEILQSRLDAMKREKAIKSRRGFLAPGDEGYREELQLVKSWRSGDVAAVLQLCDQRTQMADVNKQLKKALEKELTYMLRLYWCNASDDFGLCWLSFSALAVVLKAWGFGIHESTTLAKRCQRLGLTSLASPVVDKNSVKVSGRKVTLG